MRALSLLLLAGIAAANDAGIAKAHEVAKAGPAAAREAVPELIALGKGAPQERFAARDALVVAGPPALAKIIEGASGDANLRLLLEGVSFDLRAGVVAPALPLLAAENPKVRAMAAVSLGAAGAGGEAAVKHLVGTLHDGDPEVRREAAIALGRIGRGAHDAIPGLIHLANDAARGCQGEALLAMGAILRDAAEREQPAPKVAPEVAKAVERGIAWLAEEQGDDGWWEYTHDIGSSAPKHVARERASLTALALLAMLEGGREPPAAKVRAASRCLAGLDGTEGLFHVPAGEVGPVEAGLCAATRLTGEPECRAAADRALGTRPGPGPYVYGWRAACYVEARFAGLARTPPRLADDYPEMGLGELAIVGVVLGKDAASDARFRTALELGIHEPGEDPVPTFFAVRARRYAGMKSDEMVASIRASQKEDGSWDLKGNPRGPLHSTAVMLLCLEAASGLSRPFTLPLPDAPQLKAAVATLRIASQSKDGAIKAAAEQALAGFAVR